MENIRFAIFQGNFLLGDFIYNKNKIYDAINIAKKNNVDVLILTEYALSGAFPFDLLKKEDFLLKEEKFLEDIINFSENMILIIGGTNKAKSEKLNDFDFSLKKLKKTKIEKVAFVIGNKKIIFRYNKKYLQNFGKYDEKNYFSQNESNNECFTFKKNDKFLNFLLSMGEDFFNFNFDFCNFKNYKIDLIINLSSIPYYVNSNVETIEKYLNFLNKNELNISLLNSNYLGIADSVVFSGGSFILNENKEIFLAKEFDEDFLIFDMKLKKHENNEKNNFVIDITKKDMKIFVYKEIQKEKNIEFRICKNFVTFYKDIFVSEIESIYNAIIFSLKEFFKRNNIKKAILGLSGGIDSALVLALLSIAIDKKNIYAVSMPSIYSSDGTKNDAFTMAKNLDVNFLEIPIEKIQTNFLEIFDNNLIFRENKNFTDVAIQNIQARIRGNLLMMLANSIGGVVIATGNKSEILTGYCTLYGDTVGGYSPISDIYKTKVFELARFINEKFQKELILNSIINRIPSAELCYNQKDSDTLPEYEILDIILEMYIDKNMNIDIIKQFLLEKLKLKLKLKYSADIDFILNKVINLVKNSEYKRHQISFGPKIMKGSYKKNMPIINNFHVI